jgi:hypothetical protein
MTITKEQIADYIINSPSLMCDSDYEYHVFYNFEEKKLVYENNDDYYEIVEVYAKADYLEEHENELNEQAKLETGEDFETENEWKTYKEEHSYIDSEIMEKMRNYVDETEDKNFKPFMQLCDYLAYKLEKEI